MFVVILFKYYQIIISSKTLKSSIEIIKLLWKEFYKNIPLRFYSKVKANAETFSVASILSGSVHMKSKANSFWELWNINFRNVNIQCKMECPSKYNPRSYGRIIIFYVRSILYYILIVIRIIFQWYQKILLCSWYMLSLNKFDQVRKSALILYYSLHICRAWSNEVTANICSCSNRFINITKKT